MTTADVAISTVAWPGFPPRLLTEEREDLAAYRERGGDRLLGDAEELLAEVDASGLLGRGGACLLYTSDAADDMQCVDLGGRPSGCLLYTSPSPRD